jgi:hypothetical protein
MAESSGVNREVMPDTTTATVPSNLVIMLANQLPMRTDNACCTAELDKIKQQIAETDARMKDLRLSEVLLRLELLPAGLDGPLMDLARRVHFDTLDEIDWHVPIGELTLRLAV